MGWHVTERCMFGIHSAPFIVVFLLFRVAGKIVSFCTLRRKAWSVR
jgi:uncharacterized integral membrane protein